MGLKIVLFFAITTIVNGGVIEETKHTSRLSYAAKHYDDIPQTGLNSTASDSSTDNEGIADGARILSSGRTIDPDEEYTEEGDGNNTRKTRAANYYCDDSGDFHSTPATQKLVVERLDHPSRAVRAAGNFNDDQEHQSPTIYGENLNSDEHSSGAKTENGLDGGPSPQETSDDEAGEKKIEKLSDLPRSARQICYERCQPQSGTPVACNPTVCFTTTTPPSCPVCPAPCPVCPTTCPVDCPTTSTQSSCCVPPSCANGGPTQSYYSIPPRTNNAPQPCPDTASPACPPNCSPASPPYYPPACPANCPPASPAYCTPACPAYCPQASPDNCSPASPAYFPPACPPNCSPASPPYYPPACPANCPPASPAYCTPACPAYCPQASPDNCSPASPAYFPPASPVYCPPASPAYCPPASPAYCPPACPSYCPPASPAYCPPACPGNCPPACPTKPPPPCSIIGPPACPTKTTSPPCCGSSSSAATKSGYSSKTVYFPCSATNNNAPALPCKCAYTQKQGSTCCTATPRKTSTCPPTTAVSSNDPGTTGVLYKSGNGAGGNCMCSSMNVLCDPSCPKQRVCMMSECGNGHGGNKVSSCVNYVQCGNMLYKCGNGEGRNYVKSCCNVLGGDSSIFAGSCGPCLMNSLLTLCNCSVLGSNFLDCNDPYFHCPNCDCPNSYCPDSYCPNYNCPDSHCADFNCCYSNCPDCCDDESSEQNDPRCYQPKTTPPVDPCASKTVYACSSIPTASCNPQPTIYSCNPVLCQPTKPTSNVPAYIIHPGCSSVCSYCDH